jgi:endonuclease YncB( thermonuclease family)
VLGGCVAGLIYAGIGEHAPPEPEAAISVPVETETAEVTDPWAESRRSALILQAQEGSPGANPLTRRDRGAGVRPGSATTRVVDGDTFWYGGEKIRIADIDTPEIRGRCAYESRLAARATERMGELLEAGPFELQPIPGRDEDRYGRKLRVVTRGSRSLGDQLVAEGLARTWTGRREPWCA